VPLTAATAAVSSNDPLALLTEVAGLVIVTQTCDVVRSCVDRPFIEVCPVIAWDPDDLHSVKRGRRPSVVALPALAGTNLVVDLDRVMTLEKSIVAGWLRTPGHVSDADARAFAQALARKRVRFAFPDDFTAAAKKLQARLVEKHERQTDEGRALRALREIRVAASPSWDADPVELFFWFIRDSSDPTFEGKSWAELSAQWLSRVPPSGRFKSTEGQVATLDDLTARDYISSDPLDLDYLSSPNDDGGEL